MTFQRPVNAIVTYLVGDQEIWQDELGLIVPRIGEGVLIPVSDDVLRYRVVDVWRSFDKHGAVGFGTNVYLEDVSGGPQDLPSQLHPRYFSASEGADTVN